MLALAAFALCLARGEANRGFALGLRAVRTGSPPDDDAVETALRAHDAAVDLPTVPWLGRMRAKLEFARQCREGKDEIVVQTMRPELGPKVAP